MSSIAHAFGSDYVNLLRDGDPAIEAHFVEHFSPILLRTLRRKVRSADQAWEVRQETFLRVLAAVRSGRGLHKPERFEVFVIGVCNNIVRETYREQSRAVSLSDLEAEPVDDLPGPYARMVTRETREKLYRMLSRLGEGERKILEALFLDGQSKDEICRRLGVSRGYLRVLICRAKKRCSAKADKHRLNTVRQSRPQRASRKRSTGLLFPARDNRGDFSSFYPSVPTATSAMMESHWAS